MKRWTLFFAVALLGVFAQGCAREVHIAAAQWVDFSQWRQWWWLESMALAFLFFFVLGHRKNQKGGESSLQRICLGAAFFLAIVGVQVCLDQFVATPRYMAEAGSFWQSTTRVIDTADVPAEDHDLSAEDDTTYVVEGVTYGNVDDIPAGYGQPTMVIRTRPVVVDDSTSHLLPDSTSALAKVEQKVKKATAGPLGWLGSHWIFIPFAIWALVLFRRRRSVKGISGRMWIPVGLLSVALLQNQNFLIDLLRGIVSLPAIGFWNLFWGVVVLLFFYWRFIEARKPKTWNVDNDAQPDKRGPSPHWWGVWSAGLLGLFIPFTIIFWRASLWTSWPDRWTEGVRHAWRVPILLVLIILAVEIYAVALRLGRIKTSHLDSLKAFGQHWLDELRSWGSLFKKGRSWGLFFTLLVRLLITVLLAVVIWKLMTVAKVPVGVFTLVSLPGLYLLGGYYYPSLRTMYVPRFFRKIMGNRTMLMSKVDRFISGPCLTWWASWLPGLDMQVVPRELLEVEDIQSADVPTAMEDAASMGIKGGVSKKEFAGPTISLLGKITTLRYDPFVWLTQVSEEDRANIKPVIIRYVLAGWKALTGMLTYNQAKTRDYYEYPVRWRDLQTEPDAARKEKLIDEYLKHALMRCKVASAIYAPVPSGSGEYVIEAGEYVREDQEGVFIPATYLEHMDWVLRTMLGCAAVGVDMLDATNKEIEAAEQNYAISLRKLATAEVDKARALVEGEAEGARRAAQRAAEIQAVGDKLKDNPDNVAAMQTMIDYVGAENAGIMFGLARKIQTLMGGTTTAK